MTMSIRPPTGSRFRPAGAIDQSIMNESKALIARIDRRNVLRGSLSLGALTLLGGCDVTDTDSMQKVLTAVSAWNDRVQAFLFNPSHLAPTYSEAEVLKPPRYNGVYAIEDFPRVDMSTWKLELGGLIADKRPLTVQQIHAMPEQEMISRLVCVEGWDYIGQWSGVNLRRFLESVGADLTAKYVVFHCFDDYYGSIDMATALHPQTILATRYAREYLGDPYGYPLRLHAPTKLGFKNPKWITSIEVTNNYPGGFWEDRGFNWFSGI
jgi:DMSO/TMAO reductase YedYZ molybdopterin-dependent catalytic subunit